MRDRLGGVSHGRVFKSSGFSTGNCCPCFSPLLFSLVSALSRDVTVLCHFRTAVGLLWAPVSPPRGNACAAAPWQRNARSAPFVVGLFVICILRGMNFTGVRVIDTHEQYVFFMRENLLFLLKMFFALNYDCNDKSVPHRHMYYVHAFFCKFLKRYETNKYI